MMSDFFIEKGLSENMAEVILYTTPWCGYCVNAKRFLDQKNIPYTDHDVSGDPALRSKISALAGGWTTVPMIFIGSHFVGGYTDLLGLDRSGKLTDLLNS